MIMISACLVGVRCRYDGNEVPNPELVELFKEGRAIPICPEVLGGLDIPRASCEKVCKDGKTLVLNQQGEDCTAQFLEGARISTEIALAVGVEHAILKSKSPSCGCGQIYDGTFSRRLVDGNGLTAEAFLASGIKVWNEENYIEWLK